MLTERVERKEDMSFDGKLVLLRQSDGDIIITCIDQGFRVTSVEFCGVGAGGGRSPHTLKALQDLIGAIKKDNEENPIRQKWKWRR